MYKIVNEIENERDYFTELVNPHEMLFVGLGAKWIIVIIVLNAVYLFIFC